MLFWNESASTDEAWTLTHTLDFSNTECNVVKQNGLHSKIKRYVWWSALPNPLRLLETDNPGWETSNIKYRGLNWLFWNPVYNSRTNAMTNNSSSKPLQARSWPCLQTSLLIFFTVWETCFLLQENTLSQHMARLAIRCWADVWRRLLRQKSCFTYGCAAGGD